MKYKIRKKKVKINHKQKRKEIHKKMMKFKKPKKFKNKYQKLKVKINKHIKIKRVIKKLKKIKVFKIRSSSQSCTILKKTKVKVRHKNKCKNKMKIHIFKIKKWKITFKI